MYYDDDYETMRNHAIEELERGGWSRAEAESKFDMNDTRSKNYQPDNPQHTWLYND